jgi:cytochrome c556
MPETRGRTDLKSVSSSPMPQTSAPHTATPQIATSASSDPILWKMKEYFKKLSTQFDQSIERIENKFEDKIDKLRVDIKDDILKDILPRIVQTTGHINATNRRVN